MSAAPDELPEAERENEQSAAAEPDRTPICPHEYRAHELEALAALRNHSEISASTQWVSRISNHIEHDDQPPRPSDLVRAIVRAPHSLMLRSVGTVGVSDYRYDRDAQVIIQRSHSEGFSHDRGDDAPIRERRFSKADAKDLVRGSHLLPIGHWGVDLEAEFERYRDWQEAQR